MWGWGGDTIYDQLTIILGSSLVPREYYNSQIVQGVVKLVMAILLIVMAEHV